MTSAVAQAIRRPSLHAERTVSRAGEEREPETVFSKKKKNVCEPSVPFRNLIGFPREGGNSLTQLKEGGINETGLNQGSPSLATLTQAPP